MMPLVSTLRPRAFSRLIVSSAAIACGGASIPAVPPPPPIGPTQVANATVDATPQLAFNPPRVVLTQGGTVTFAFGSVGHNVYFDNDPAGAPANIPGVNADASVARVFSTVGVYTFNCHIHPGMRGAITVVAPDTL
jgi:plastocyanin